MIKPAPEKLKRKPAKRHPKLKPFNKEVFFNNGNKRCFAKVSLTNTYTTYYECKFSLVYDLWNNTKVNFAVSLHTEFNIASKDKSALSNAYYKTIKLIDGFKKASLRRNGQYLDLNIDKTYGNGIMIIDGENALIADCNRKIVLKNESINTYMEVVVILTQLATHLEEEFTKHNLKFRNKIHE